MAPIDIAFTPAVKAVQARKGSRRTYAEMTMGDTIDGNLAGFVAARDSAYLASASADGQPYIQHRGGPPGFLHVIDDRTIAFADLRGNRQFISTGNFSENPRAFLFLMDYVHRQRVKIWGSVRVVDDDPELIARLFPNGYRAKAEQAMLFTVTAWDANCPAHIPVLLRAADVAAAFATRDARIAALEDQLAVMRKEKIA